MANPSLQQVRDFLEKLGFQEREAGDHVVFSHEPSQTSFALPGSSEISRSNVSAIRSQLVGRNLISDARFANWLGKTAPSWRIESFPLEYWGSPAEQLDLEFLEELQLLGCRAAAISVEALNEAFVKATGPEDRRALGARMFGELAQAAEVYSVLVLASRQRSRQGITRTFVSYRTSDVRKIIEEIAGPDSPRTIGELLWSNEPQLSQETSQLFEAVIAAGRLVARNFAGEAANLWRFYEKTRHGFVVVRDIHPDGPPFFTPRGEKESVYALVPRRTHAVDERSFLDGVGFTVTSELVAAIVRGTQLLSTASMHMAGLLRGGIESRSL